MSIIYKHIDSSLSTISDLLSGENTFSVINVGNITKIELFSFENNLDNIYNTYSHDDQVKYKIDYSTDKDLLKSFENQKESINKQADEQRSQTLQRFSERLSINQIDVGTILTIPNSAINQENLIVQSNQNVKQETFKEFYVNELRFLELDSNYRHLDEELDGNLGVVRKLFPSQTVWLWSKALSDSDTIEGKMINLSPFIQSLNTSVSETGGNWSITLPPILAEYINENSNSDNFIYQSSDPSFQNFENRSKGWVMKGIQESSEVIAKSIFQDKKKGENYYFYNIIQSNDIIFIRFETLRNEVKERIKSNKSFEVSNSEIPNGIYDMIGLVDTVEINVNSLSNEVSITVKGRDLVKLLIDDGTYFFATDYIEGGSFVQNQDDESRRKSNERIEGKLYQLSLSAIKSIDFSLKFIINALSNISICNDTVFSSYKSAEEITGYDYLKNKFITQTADITSKRSNIVFKDKEKTQFSIEEKNMPGIWQIIKLVVDSNVENYRQVDATLGNEMGSILNAINKICQRPFCEFFTDTYRNQFFFIVRRPPTDYVGYKALADVAITVKSEDVLNYDLNFSDRDIYSWFRFQPQASVDELGLKTVWAYLKAIRFEEYASIYGDKALQIVSNYLHYQSVIGQNEILNINSVTRQFIIDFKYLIESYQYTPFVRSGNVIINGDRRIKRGTVIYFEKTDEFCYVENVSQSYNIGESIDRTTTVQVSRCMISSHLDNYFKIIDLPLDDRLFQNSNVSYEEFIENSMTKWKVNKQIFNFFLKRMQFTETEKMNIEKKNEKSQVTGKLRLK